VQSTLTEKKDTFKARWKKIGGASREGKLPMDPRTGGSANVKRMELKES